MADNALAEGTLAGAWDAHNEAGLPQLEERDIQKAVQRCRRQSQERDSQKAVRMV